MHARAQASNRMTNANRASRGPRVRGKGKNKENKRKSKGKSKGAKGAKGSHNGKTSKTGLSGLENLKSETSSESQESGHVCTTDNSWLHDGLSPDEWNDGWSYDEWDDDWSSDGWHEAWEQTYDNSASSFSLGSLDLGAMSGPKRFEWVQMNQVHRSCSEHIPIERWSDGAGDGRFYRTASGEWIPDGEA